MLDANKENPSKRKRDFSGRGGEICTRSLAGRPGLYAWGGREWCCPRRCSPPRILAWPRCGSAADRPPHQLGTNSKPTRGLHPAAAPPPPMMLPATGGLPPPPPGHRLPKMTSRPRRTAPQHICMMQQEIELYGVSNRPDGSSAIRTIPPTLSGLRQRLCVIGCTGIVAFERPKK